MSQTLGQTRVVDPILTTHVQGYRQAGLVGHYLFPRAPVSVAGGRVLEFGKEAFREYNTGRAPGSATSRISFGYEGKPYAVFPHSLEAPVPRERLRDASRGPGIDLGMRATSLTMQVIALSLEREQASIAVNAANYDADHKQAFAGGTKWSAATGTPLTDIANAKEAIRKTIGLRPNTLVLSPDAWTSAELNPQVVARIYPDRGPGEVGPVSLEHFSKVIGVPNVVVGEAVTAGADDAFSDVWGNNAVLAYVSQNPSPQMEEPSYGYTYTMEGHPMVEVPYYDNNAKSWIYGVTNERTPQLTGMVAGFLFQNPK
ncbi:MAG: hypothetical protein ACPGOY_06960 [Rhodospirillaceae bacterium]